VKPNAKVRLFAAAGLILTAGILLGGTPRIPADVEQMWADFDPCEDPLDVEVIRQWNEGGAVCRYVLYTIGTFKGRKARMAAFYAFPKGGKRLPAVMHMHGGGQRASLHAVKYYAGRGYAALSVNWGGRPMENAKPGDPNTDWGAVDPTQKNVPGYFNMKPGPKYLDDRLSPRNNNWYLLTIGCRRGLTFLEQQPEVDPDRLGIYGHSMGGQLTAMVAGSDRRVKAAVPSVGGAAKLPLWGLEGTGARVREGKELYLNTIAGQASSRHVQCPYLFLSATNDFNAPMDNAVKAMALVPHERKRMTFAPHLNHRFTPEHAVCRPLWLDAHLKEAIAFPTTPASELILKQSDGIPLFRVTPDHSKKIAKVDIYYGYGRDPRNRFWRATEAKEAGDAWEAVCPVMDLEEPLFAFANVTYELDREVPMPHGGPVNSFTLSSEFQAAYPEDLKAAGVKATERPSRLIDDFSRGFHDWYRLSPTNPHHWCYATRKPADPKWMGPKGAKLAFEIQTTKPNERLGVVIKTNEWRPYAGRKSVDYVAVVPLAKAGWQEVELAAADFKSGDPKHPVLADWDEITQLMFQPADKALAKMPKSAGAAKEKLWQGDSPRLRNLHWVGGEYTPRRKPYLPDQADKKVNAGKEFQKQFQKGIDDSIRREKLDGAKK